MADEQADLCFTSPPYLHQREYITGVGDWDELMQGVFSNVPMRHEGQILVNLGHIHRNGEVQEYWINWRQWMRSQGWRFFASYVWDKGAGLPGDWSGRLAPSFEHLFHFNHIAKKPNKTKEKQPASIKYRNGKDLLRKPDGTTSESAPSRETFLSTHKIPDDVIRVGRARASRVAHIHPAVFPVKLATEVITAYSDPQQIVYEPFSGSGTTIIGAQKTGRRCRAVELQPEYCDNTIRHIQKETGLVAVHAQSRRWFEVPDWLEFKQRAPTAQTDGANDNAMANAAVV
jgi:DNA modification methylase